MKILDRTPALAFVSAFLGFTTLFGATTAFADEPEHSYSTMYIFGDSISDSGNAFALNGLTAHPPFEPIPSAILAGSITDEQGQPLEGNFGSWKLSRIDLVEPYREYFSITMADTEELRKEVFRLRYDVYCRECVSIRNYLRPDDHGAGYDQSCDQLPREPDD